MLRHLKSRPSPIKHKNLTAICKYALLVPNLLSLDLKLFTIVNPITNINIAANKSAKEIPGKTWKPASPCSTIGARKLKHEKIGKIKEQTIRNIHNPLNLSIEIILSVLALFDG